MKAKYQNKNLNMLQGEEFLKSLRFLPNPRIIRTYQGTGQTQT